GPRHHRHHGGARHVAGVAGGEPGAVHEPGREAGAWDARRRAGRPGRDFRVPGNMSVAAPMHAPALLAVRNLETWYGPVSAIKGISLDVPEAGLVAVLGANGAGKTTLLNTIAGVIDPFKGSVEFRGEAIHGRDPDWVARRGVVLVPEGRQVFPFLTVRENLMMGTFARGRQQG